MARKQEIYVSFEKDEYKKGKSDILECQADLLKVMRYLENLKRWGVEKRRAKIQLAGIFSEVKFALGELNEKLPDAKMPMKIKGTEEIKIEEHTEKYREIDAELKEIQEKLRELT